MTEPIRDTAMSTTMSSDAVIDKEGNLTVAFLRFNIHTNLMGFHWLPEFFGHGPIPDALRKDIIERLRLHADKLENGELERDMARYSHINTPDKKPD